MLAHAAGIGNLNVRGGGGEEDVRGYCICCGALILVSILYAANVLRKVAK